MPFARLFAFVLLAAAPAAHAQRGLIARSYAEADTSQAVLIRAFIATADSIGATLALDSVYIGVLHARVGTTSLRVAVGRGAQRRASVLATADFGARMPESGPASYPQLRWVGFALQALFPYPVSHRAETYSLVALDVNVPFCPNVEAYPRSNGTDRWPVPDSQQEPSYPAAARRQGLEAYVVVQATVDEAGRVTCAGAVSAMPFEFSDSAVLAVSKWTFKPAIVEGRPSAASVRLPVRFRIRD